MTPTLSPACGDLASHPLEDNCPTQIDWAGMPRSVRIPAPQSSPRGLPLRCRMRRFLATLGIISVILAATPTTAEAQGRQRMRERGGKAASSRPYHEGYQRAEQPWERCHKAAQRIDYPIWAQGWSIECVDGPVVEGRRWLGVCRCWAGMHWSQVQIRVDASSRHSDATVAFVLAHEVAHAHFAVHEPERFNDRWGRPDERGADRWAYDHLKS